MRIKSLIIFFILNTLLYSNNIDIQKIVNDDNKSSIQKDYDLFLYLKKESISSLDSLNILSSISNVNKYIFEEFAKKSGHDETMATFLCINANADELVTTNSDCIAAGITFDKAFLLNNLQLNEIIEKLRENYSTLSKRLKIVNSPIPFTKLVSSSKEDIYDILLNTPSSFKAGKLNYRLPKSTLKKVIDDQRFEKLLKSIISNSKLNYLQSTFFDLEDEKFSYEVSFLLGLNRFVNNKKDEKTLNYFYNALLKAQNQTQKDRVNFWLYKMTDNINYKENLLKSNSINIYTIDNKIDNFEDNYSVINFNNIENNCSLKNQIYINSYVKTLTNFDNRYINSEFNLGLTHLNLDLLTKIKDKESIYYEKLFDQEVNIKYFIESLNYLKSNFYNDLLVFYSYLDGIKYVKNQFSFLNYNIDNLMPLLLLEVYPDDKKTKLAKEFVVNYLIYSKKLNDKQSVINSSFENLFEPL